MPRGRLPLGGGPSFLFGDSGSGDCIRSGRPKMVVCFGLKFSGADDYDQEPIIVTKCDLSAAFRVSAWATEELP